MSTVECTRRNRGKELYDYCIGMSVFLSISIVAVGIRALIPRDERVFTLVSFGTMFIAATVLLGIIVDGSVNDKSMYDTDPNCYDQTHSKSYLNNWLLTMTSLTFVVALIALPIFAFWKPVQSTANLASASIDYGANTTRSVLNNTGRATYDLAYAPIDYAAGTTDRAVGGTLRTADMAVDMAKAPLNTRYPRFVPPN